MATRRGRARGPTIADVNVSVEVDGIERAERALDRLTRALLRVRAAGGSTTKGFTEVDRATRDVTTSMQKATQATKGHNTAQKRLRDTLLSASKNTDRLLGKLRALFFFTGLITSAIVALREEMAALAATIGGVLVEVQLEAAEQRLASVADTTAVVTQRMSAFRDIANATGTRLIGLVDQMAALTAAASAQGDTFESTRTILRGFIEAQSALGATNNEIQNSLEDVTELLKADRVAVEDLRDAVEFTNDPIRTLANALQLTESRVEAMIAVGTTLSRDVLVDVARHLRENAGETNTLSDAFNRLVNEATELFEIFNRTGVIDALIGLMDRLGEVLHSELVVGAIQAMGRGMTEFISTTLPRFTASMVQNWESILDVIRGIAGALIGLAAGGVVGGLIGAIIGGHDKLRETVLGAAGSFGSFAFDVIRFMNGAREDITREAELVGRALSGIAETATLAARAIIVGFRSAGQVIGGVSAAVVQAAQGNFRRAGLIMSELSADLDENIQGLLGNLDAAVDRLGELARSGTSTTKDMMDLGRAAQDAGTQIEITGDEAESTGNRGSSAFQRFADNVREAAMDFGTLEQAARRVGNTIRESFVTAFASVLQGAKTLGDALENAFASIVDAILQELARLAAQEVFKLVISLLQGGGGAVEAGTGQTANTGGIGGALSGAAAGAQIGSVVPVIGTAFGAIAGGILGAFGMDDLFQTGGERIVTQPTLLGVGEHNQPERVTVEPLSGAGRGGQGAVVFQGPTIVDEISMNRFTRRIAESQRRERRREVF